MARDELARGRALTAAARAVLSKSPGRTTEAHLDRLGDYTTQLDMEEHTMPPKGQRTLGEDREVVSIRLTRSAVARIDAIVERLRKQHPYLPINRVHAVMYLLDRDSETPGADVTDTVTDTPLTDTVPDPTESPVVTTVKTARPKAAAKKRTTRTTKGRK